MERGFSKCIENLKTCINHQSLIMKKKIVFALLMGLITTGMISFTLIAINLGFSERFLQVWFKSWVMAYIIVIPVILIIGPIVQKLTDKMVKDENN